MTTDQIGHLSIISIILMGAIAFTIGLAHVIFTNKEFPGTTRSFITGGLWGIAYFLHQYWN